MVNFEAMEVDKDDRDDGGGTAHTGPVIVIHYVMFLLPL